MAGNRRSSTLLKNIGSWTIELGMAGNRRSSTLRKEYGHTLSGWGWPGIAAQVHSRAEWSGDGTWLGMAGNRRSSTLNRCGHALLLTLGMAGNRRSSTLDRAEPTEKQWVGAVLLFQKRRICSGISSGSRGFIP